MHPTDDERDPTPQAPGVPRNFYASAEFLDVLAKVYFPGRDCRVEDFGLAGMTFRLLTIDGRPLVGPQRFLDLHEPLQDAHLASATRRIPRLAVVGRELVRADEFRTDEAWRDFEGAPTVLWGGFASWNDYLELLRARRVLAEDQRRNRRLQEARGPLEFTVDDVRDDVLPTSFSWKSARDRAMGRDDVFAQAQNREFFLQLRAKGLLRASTLRGSGELLAIWLGTVYQGRWTGWIFAFNPDESLARYSLGRQLLHPMLEESYRAGHTEFDFSIGLESYKLFFATHVRPIASLGRPLLRERLRMVAKGLLRNQPWLYRRAKALVGNRF